MNDGIYQTYDLVLAAYLITGDLCRLSNIQSSGNSRKLFCFDPTPTKEQLIGFYSGEAMVLARRSAEVHASLEGML